MSRALLKKKVTTVDLREIRHQLDKVRTTLAMALQELPTETVEAELYVHSTQLSLNKLGEIINTLEMAEESS